MPAHQTGVILKYPAGHNLKRCPAMIEAGIINPGSQEGIDFCVHWCPYPKCIVMEGAEEEDGQKIGKE